MDRIGSIHSPLKYNKSEEIKPPAPKVLRTLGMRSHMPRQPPQASPAHVTNQHKPRSICPAQVPPILLKPDTGYFSPQLSGNEFFSPEQRDWMDFGKKVDGWSLQPAELCSMPCMAETSAHILEDINKFLSYHGLSADDKQALENFKQKVLALREENYPYKKSLEVALLFPLIQNLFYCFACPRMSVTQKKKIKDCTIDRIPARWQALKLGPCSLHNLIQQPWRRLYEKTAEDPEYKKLIRIYEAVGNLTNEMGNHDNDAIRSLHRLRGRRIIPTFSPFTLKILNTFHFLPVIPVNLTHSICERHDAIWMCPAYLTIHDLLHDLYNIDSCLVQTSHQRFLSYLAIVSYYRYATAIPPEIHRAGELILLQKLHEQGGDLNNLLDIKDTLDIAQNVSKQFYRDVFSDMPRDYASIYQSSHLPTGALWLSVFLSYFLQKQKPTERHAERTGPYEQFQLAQRKMISRLEACRAISEDSPLYRMLPCDNSPYGSGKQLCDYGSGACHSLAQDKDLKEFFKQPAGSWYILDPRFDAIWGKIMEQLPR